ncbi:MAG: efflux RND transporter permease subunit [Pseudomonadota bacterium]
MNLSRNSINRPIFTIMVVLIVLILGGISLMRLPIDLMPDITYPTLSVFSEYENASPEEVETLLTRPIEGAMTAVPGVEEVTSVSSEGSSSVRITFSWGIDLDAAANDVRDRLDRVIGNLPEDVERPTLRKFDVASFPVLILGAYSDLDPVQMRRIIDEQIIYRLERIPGVAEIAVRGGLDRQIHVNLDADKIKALGLPLDQILNKIKSENVTLPAGSLERGNLEVLIRTPGDYTSLDDLRNIVIALREGVTIQLKEIADVEDAWEKFSRIVRVNGRPGIRIAVNKQSGKNTVEIARAVHLELERIKLDFPQIQLTPIIDTSDYIRRAISNVGSSLLYGGILAVIVIFLFLRDFRSTAIIATAIPTSIIATFTLMYFGGFTLNLMTLGGLALGVGMMVDNSIVVLENICRIRQSNPAVKAAVEGSDEVTAAIFASTLTTLAVFLPLIFVRGMTGVMFKQLSYVIGFALICSLSVALTLVPMLSAKFLTREEARPEDGETLSRKIFRVSDRWFTDMEDAYKRLLHFSLNHRLLVVITAIIFLGGSLFLIPFVGVEFMPKTDEGEVRIRVEMAVGTRLEVVDKKLMAIDALIAKEVPEARNRVTFIGGSRFRGRASHTGEIRIALKPKKERLRSSEEIAAALRRKLTNIPGMTLRTRAGQGLFILQLGSMGGESIQIEIRGHDLDTADRLATRISDMISGVEGITDVMISRESGNPEELVIVDRQKAADMKLSVSQIANMLQTALTGTRASNFREGGDEFSILVKLRNADRLALNELLDLTLTNAEGRPVVLRNVVQVKPWSGPVMIERKDQERLVTVAANNTGRDMGSVIADIRDRLRSLPLPKDFTISFGGDFEEQQKAFRELLLGFVLALILVYMVMACLYESLRDPFIVMFSVPMAVIGVILMLLLTKTTFNVQSYIGCIMLGGIVVNNAILLVDHTNLLRRRDCMPLREAIEEAGRRRLRPILMTATTTMLALLPLAVGLGEGGEAQAPMARAVIGGILSSTLITLVFVPTVYTLFESPAEKERCTLPETPEEDSKP